MAKLLVVKLNQFSDEPEGRRCGVLYVHVCCTSGASKLSITSHLLGFPERIYSWRGMLVIYLAIQPNCTSLCIVSTAKN